MGHKVSTMKLPAERLVFIDAIDWWTHWHSADPGRGWNQYGQMSIEDYKDINLHGPVIYRHSEGANAAFYDGHVKYYPKGALFNKKDYEVKPRKPGMWVMDLKMYYARNP
jgi:prepilin-type processing-associated H-X9-DG protein